MRRSEEPVPDVFLSYSRQDEKLAGRFAQLLENEGLTVWWDRKIPPGKTWDQVIGTALDEARCVVVLWTPASVKSDWVKEEASRAARRGVLVPALLEEAEAPLGFGRIEAAELSGWRGETDNEELQAFLAAVRELAGRESPPTAGGTAGQRPARSRRWRLPRAVGVVAALAVLAVIGWTLLDSAGSVLDVKLWNVERDRKGEVLVARSFELTSGDSGSSAETLAQIAAWVGESITPAADSSGPVQIRLTVPADLAQERIRIHADAEIELATYLYMFGGSLKERLPSKLRPEDLEFVGEEFTIEIAAKGYDSLPVRIRKGQPQERSLELSPLAIKLAIEQFSGADNRFAAQLTELLTAPENSRTAGLKVLGPGALQQLRDEIARVHENIGSNRAAQVAIRDSLGVDYILGGSYSEK